MSKPQPGQGQTNHNYIGEISQCQPVKWSFRILSINSCKPGDPQVKPITNDNQQNSCTDRYHGWDKPFHVQDLLIFVSSIQAASVSRHRQPGGTRQRHFAGNNSKPRKRLENAARTPSRLHALLGSHILRTQSADSNNLLWLCHGDRLKRLYMVSIDYTKRMPNEGILFSSITWLK